MNVDTAARPRRPAALVFLLMSAAGCGTSARDLSLDDAAARAALTASLDAWKSGKKPADLKPDLIVGDWDWEAGKTLVKYQVMPGETDDGTNLRVSVRLTLRDAEGKEAEPRVSYAVGTSPVVTVMREDI